MRKVLFELVLLGVAIGLTVEVIKSAIPYLPVIWLAIGAHYAWEGATSKYVIVRAKGIKSKWLGRSSVYGYLIVGALAAALFCLYWWGLTAFFAPKIAAYEAEQETAKTPKTSDAVTQKELFKVSIPTSFINLSQRLETTKSAMTLEEKAALGIWWVTYGSMYGDTASPVALLQFVELTNLLSTPESIKSFTLAINTESCGWIYLSPIDIRGKQVWFTNSGLHDADLFDFTTNGLSYLLEKSIPPGETIKGWWFFDSKVECTMLPRSMVQFKLNLETYSGVRYEFTTDRQVLGTTIDKGNTIGNTSIVPLVVPPGKPRADISGYYRKLYSAPYEEPPVKRQ